MSTREPRGRYHKGIEMRERIIDAALEAYADSDSRGPSIKAIAESVGLTDKGLNHYFASRDELLLAVLQERDRLDAIPVDPDDPQSISYIVGYIAARNHSKPGLVKLYLDMAVAASDPAHVAHDFFVQRYEDLRGAIEGHLIHIGRAPEQAHWQAQALLAAADGLQIQWLLDPTINVARAAVGVARLIEGSAGPEDS